MEDTFIEAVRTNDINLATEILRDNPRIISGKRYFDVVKSIKGTEMISLILNVFGHDLIKFYRNHAVSILVHAMEERISWKVIEKIVSFDTDTINQVNGDGLTPLMYAVETNKSINVIRYIISKNGDVNRCNTDGQSSLHFACNTAVVKLLIRSGANVNCIDNSGSTPLMTLMTSLKDKKGLFYLLQRGADTNICNIEGQNALHLVLKLKLDTGLVLKILNRIDVVHLNSEDKMSNTPLFYAFDNFSVYNKKQKKIVFKLINKGCKVSQRVFMLAVTHRESYKIIKKLVDYVDVKDCIDSEGRNVLHLVNDFSLVKLLVHKGALINHCDHKGATPLIEAVNCFKDVELIESLLSYGAQVDDLPYFVDFDLLFCTTILRHNLIVDLLILHGMNIGLKNQYIKYFLSKICTTVCRRYPRLSIFQSSLLRYLFLSDTNVIIPKLPIMDSFAHTVIRNYKNEIRKMKQINIIDTVSFYDFCLSKHKSLRRSIDESNCIYVRDDYKKIKEVFPKFFAEIIIKIKINFKIHKRRALLRKLLCISIRYVAAESVNNIHFSELQSNSKSTFLFNFIDLNLDCLYYVGNYLHDRDLSRLLAASI